MYESRFTFVQMIGFVILGATTLVPGLSLAGFHGGTAWSVMGWVCVSIGGGFVAGLLIARKHRIAGAIGAMIGAPLGLLALYFYARNRETIYRSEATIVSLVGSLPGFVVYFVLRLLTDLIFPAVREPDDDDEEDDDDKPRRKRSKRRDDDEAEEDDKPKRGRSKRRDDDEEDEDDERPKKRRRL